MENLSGLWMFQRKRKEVGRKEAGQFKLLLVSYFLKLCNTDFCIFQVTKNNFWASNKSMDKLVRVDFVSIIYKSFVNIWIWIRNIAWYLIGQYNRCSLVIGRLWGWQLGCDNFLDLATFCLSQLDKSYLMSRSTQNK